LQVLCKVANCGVVVRTSVWVVCIIDVACSIYAGVPDPVSYHLDGWASGIFTFLSLKTRPSLPGPVSRSLGPVPSAMLLATLRCGCVESSTTAFYRAMLRRGRLCHRNGWFTSASKSNSTFCRQHRSAVTLTGDYSRRIRTSAFCGILCLLMLLCNG